MPNQKITQLASAASAQASTLYPVVSGGNANKSITQHTMLKSLGIPQYVEATCRATATVAFLPRCNIFDIYVKPLALSSGAAGGTLVNVGIGANASLFAQVVVSSYGAIYGPLTPNADGGWGAMADLQNVSGSIVAAAPTASAGANFVVGIGYFRV